MRTVARRLSAGAGAPQSPVAPRANARHTAINGLVGLWAPFDRGGRIFVGRHEVENYAPFSYAPAAIIGNRFLARAGTGTTWRPPDVNTDLIGPYWDYSSSGRDLRIYDSSSLVPWRPGSFGGYAPGTLLAVIRVIAVPSGSANVIVGTGTGSGALLALYYTSSSISAWIGTGSIVAVPSGISPVVGRAYAVLFSTRSPTDHQVVVRDLMSGEVSSATSSTSSGTSGGVPGNFDVGYLNGSNLAANARFYLLAHWARGMPDAEMRDVIHAPFSLLQPGVPRRLIATRSGSRTGDLDVTLDEVALSAMGLVPVAASVVANLDAVSIQAAGSVPVTAAVDAALVDVSALAYAQVGEGVIGSIGDAAIALDDLTLSGEATVSAVGDLEVTLGDLGVASFGSAGPTGPFTPRPFLVLN